MELTGKTILIISPQPWSNMFVSKHHYAIELMKRGNIIYFLQPLGSTPENTDKYYPNLHILNHKKFFGEVLRFHYRPLYKFLLSIQLNKLLKTIQTPLDVVLSFDNTAKYPNLSIFKAKKYIFFPVDQINMNHLSEYKTYGDFIFSISPLILDSFKSHHSKKILLNHGLGNNWVQKAEEKINNKTLTSSDNINVGYFGNLNFGRGLDMNTIKLVISKHTNINFHFWGNNQVDDNSSAEVKKWMIFLENSKNVTLYGSTAQNDLVQQIDSIDAFILCYDYRYEINKCSNSHKILEYLSTGKVVISNKMSMYNNHNDIFNMLPDFSNKDYIHLFDNTIENIEHYNNSELQLKRKEFAMQNTYAKQVLRIEEQLTL